MRRGSLSERYVKCSKPGCACAERPAARHGPYYSLTRTVGGRTQSRFVPAEQADLVREQIAAGQQFRAPRGGVLGGLRALGRRPARRPRGRRGGRKRGLCAAFAAEIVAEIEALVGPGAVDGWDFEAIETAVRRQALRVAARAVEQRLNADTCGPRRPTAPCACGQAARYAGRRPKTFTSVLGELDPGARLLPLRRVRARLLSARSGAGARGHRRCRRP